nr:ulp1 protease family, C-terminal catalytic domain-containing protein [Tanacetum cinerariifolium]
MMMSKNRHFYHVKLRAQARARGQKQITRPRVGPKGYRGFEKQWEEERNDHDKATELHLIPDLRSSNYCLARAPRDKVGIKPFPAKLIDVSKKLAHAASELSQSSNESESGVDPLIMKLRKGHMKVAILKVMEKHKNMELLMPNDELPYLESAVNGFIEWLIFAIGRYKGMSKPPVTEVPTKRLMLQHERAPSSKNGKVNDTPKEPNKKDKASTNKKIDTSRFAHATADVLVIGQVENEKAANRKRLQDLENDILTKPQSVIDGYNKWMSHADIAEMYSICVNKKVFRQTDEFYFTLNATNIIELLTYGAWHLDPF